MHTNNTAHKQCGITWSHQQTPCSAWSAQHMAGTVIAKLRRIELLVLFADPALSVRFKVRNRNRFFCGSSAGDSRQNIIVYFLYQDIFFHGNYPFQIYRYTYLYVWYRRFGNAGMQFFSFFIITYKDKKSNRGREHKQLSVINTASGARAPRLYHIKIKKQ